MNNLINTLQDIKGFFDNKRLVNPLQEEKPSLKMGHSMTTKGSRPIYFRSPTEPPDNKSDSTGIRKSFSNISSFVASGTLKQVNLNYMVNFMDLLLQKFKTDLSFHVANSSIISRLQSEPTTSRAELSLIKNLLDFECFTLHTKKEKPYFYKAEAIVDRYKLMVSMLEEGLSSLRKENLMKAVAFFDESEFQKCIMKYFSPSLFEHQYFRIVCSELFRFMRGHKLGEPNQHNIQLSFDNLKLFLYGISFPSPFAEDYPLHQAVFSSNLPMIRRILAREKSPVFSAHIEQSDPLGVTPLMLAILLGNKDAALILTNHGANPKHRSYPYARTPLEEAIFRKNRSMVKLLLLAKISIKQAQWEENKQHLIEFLKKIPDFSFEMNWECDSKIIPFVKKVTPSDTYKVYKRGSSIRIDLSLLGWSKLKSIRGNSSIIFNGSGAEEGKLLMIDHIKKHSVDILSDVNSLALENKVDELIKHEQMNSEIKADNVVFKPATTWKGENVKTNINGIDCAKFIAKGTFSLLFTRRNVLLDIDAHDFESFEQYFDCVLQQPLWILEDNNGRVDWNQSPFVKVKHFADSYQAVVRALFEKEGKENIKNVNINQKATKENEKMNLSQKKLLKNYTKNIVATIYMCEKFPINLDHLFPVLDILANVSPHINRLKSFLERTISFNKSNFPIKACIPIFFSVNAIISLRGFNFKSPDITLFDIDTMIQKKPKKASEYVYRDERFRTEGGSDDEQAQHRWQELLQDESEEGVGGGTPGLIKFEYKEEESEDDLEYVEGPQRSNQQSYKSFFNKRESITNQDLVNVFIPEVDDDFDGGDLDDLDICEKYRNETLKLSSHGMEAPKTISFLQEKFKSPSHSIKTENNYDRFEIKREVLTMGAQSTQHKKTIDNTHLLKSKTNYKFLGKLNDNLPRTEQAGGTSRRESLFSKNFNEVDFSENLKEVQMKKLMKYTMKKKNLMSKLNIPKQVYREETHEDDQDDQKALEEHPGSKTSKKIKHERIRSLEYPNKTTIENFCNNLMKANTKIDGTGK